MESKEIENLEAQVRVLTNRVNDLEQKVAQLSGGIPPVYNQQPQQYQQEERDFQQPVETYNNQVNEPFYSQADVLTNTQEEPDYDNCFHKNNAVQDRPEQRNDAAFNNQQDFNHSAGYNNPTVQKPSNYSRTSSDESATESIESKIGKKLMGIAATILVIISLVLFGKLLSNVMTDSIKICLMFGISFIFTIFGIYKYKSATEKYQVLYSSIAGCGLCSIYISCLLSCFYFEIFSTATLNWILLVWLAITAVLAKYVCKMFLYICNIGLIIASFIAIGNHHTEFGTIIYYLGMTTLFLTNRNKVFAKDCHYITQMHLLSMVYLFCNNRNDLTAVLIMAYNLASFVLTHYYYEKDSNKDIFLNIANQTFLSINCTIVLFFNAFYEVEPYQLAIVSFINSILTIMQYRKYNLKKHEIWLSSYYLTLFCTLFYCFGFISDYLSYMPICVLLLLLDHFFNNKHFRYSSFLFLLLSSEVFPKLLPAYTSFVFTILFIAYYAYKYFRKSYFIADKLILSYLFFGSLFATFKAYQPSAFIIFVTLALLSIFFNSKLYRINYQTREEELATTIISYVYNAIILLYGLIMTATYDHEYVLSDTVTFSKGVVATILIALTMTLSFVNIKHLFNSNVSKTFYGIYTGTKLLVVLFAIMYRLEAISLIVTLSTLAFAVICIAIGFRIEVKSLRLYGLVLNLIFILKLILFDIRYDSAILRPVGFLVAGVLCFVVSWLYSKLEKRMIRPADKI